MIQKNQEITKKQQLDESESDDSDADDEEADKDTEVTSDTKPASYNPWMGNAPSQKPAFNQLQAVINKDAQHSEDEEEEAGDSNDGDNVQEDEEDGSEDEGDDDDEDDGQIEQIFKDIEKHQQPADKSSRKQPGN